MEKADCKKSSMWGRKDEGEKMTLFYLLEGVFPFFFL